MEFGIDEATKDRRPSSAVGGVRVNRPQTRGRTAPSAHDWEEIDIYVALESVRGLQSFVAQTPVNLVYVADLSRMVQATPQEQAQLAGLMGLTPQQKIILAQSVGYPAAA